MELVPDARSIMDDIGACGWVGLVSAHLVGGGNKWTVNKRTGLVFPPSPYSPPPQLNSPGCDSLCSSVLVAHSFQSMVLQSIIVDPCHWGAGRASAFCCRMPSGWLQSIKGIERKTFPLEERKPSHSPHCPPLHIAITFYLDVLKLLLRYVRIFHSIIFSFHYTFL